MNTRSSLFKTLNVILLLPLWRIITAMADGVKGILCCLDSMHHGDISKIPFRRSGKVKQLGLPECSALAILRSTHTVHPIAASQVGYSPLTLDIEDPQIAVSKNARYLGIAIAAYARYVCSITSLVEYLRLQ